MKPFNSNEVLSSAIYNFTLLELSLYMLAKSKFSDETYAHIAGLSFSQSAKTMQDILREIDFEKYKNLIQLLNEAIGVYKHRNKITHNPLMPSLKKIEGKMEVHDLLVNTKTGQPIEGYNLKEINDIGVKANALSGELARFYEL